MMFGACSRSSSVSNSGTTSRRDIGFLPVRLISPASRASSSTFSRSSTERVIETMYVQAAASPASSWMVRMALKVSTTRRVSSESFRLRERIVRFDSRADLRRFPSAAPIFVANISLTAAEWMSAWSRTSIMKPWNPCARTAA